MAWRLLETGVLKCFGKLVGTIGSELTSFVALTCDSSVTRGKFETFLLDKVSSRWVACKGNRKFSRKTLTFNQHRMRASNLLNE